MKNLITPGGMYCLEVPIEEQMKNMQEGVSYFVKKNNSENIPPMLDVLKTAEEKWMEKKDESD